MFSREEIKTKSKMQLSGRWGSVGGVYLLLLAMMLVVQYLPIDLWVVTIILTAPLAFGEYMIGYHISRDKEVGIKDAFSGFYNLGRALGMYFWMMLWTFLSTLLFIIPGIVKAYSYSMAFYILIDHPEMSIGEALKESMEITKGHKVDLFLLDMSFLGWGIVSIITFGIGFFWLLPYVQASQANAYQVLKRI